MGFSIMRTKTWTVFGAGGFINDIHDAIESKNDKLKFIVLNMELDKKVVAKIPGVIKIISIDDFKPATDFYFFGFLNPNKGPLLEILKVHSLTYANLVHKFSYISKTVQMGQGNFIGAGVVLAPNVRLGNFNYINRTVSIGHDTNIADFNHIGPGSTVAGNCKIGSKIFLGTGSKVIENIKIVDEIIVGAGGVVVKNLLEGGTYVGVPANKIK